MRFIRNAVCALLLMALCFTACANVPDEPLQVSSSSSDRRVQILHYDTTDNFELTSQIVATFNRQSKNTYVAVRYLDNDSYDDWIRDSLREGMLEADSLYLRQPGQVNQYASEGLLRDITDYVAEYQLDVASYGSTLDIVNLDNRLYSLPRAKSAWLLFYNKAIFDEYNIPYPEQLTWEEYADLAQRLTSGTGSKKIWGGFIPQWSLNLGAIAANEYLTDDELPATRQFVSLLDRLYNVDKSHQSVEMMEENAGRPYTLFATGRLAMMIVGDWAASMVHEAALRARTEVDWDVAPLPVFEYVQPYSAVSGCSYMAINQKSRKSENAMEFILYYCGAEGAEISARNAVCPAYFTERSAQLYLQAAGVPGAKYAFESQLYMEEGSHILYRDIKDAFNLHMIAYLKGEYESLEYAFDRFYEKRLQILS